MKIGRIRPSRTLMPVCASTALVGVLYRLLILSRKDGSALARAMPYRNLVDALVHAIETAIAELNSASSTIHQAPPQSRGPRTTAGSWAEPANVFAAGAPEVSRLVPQPLVWPHETRTRNTPMIRIEPITARGTVRFGLALSSASGAAASHPVIAKIAKTTPRNRPCALLNVSQCRFTPPGPGLAKPLMARAKTVSASKMPRTMSNLTDNSTPRQAV